MTAVWDRSWNIGHEMPGDPPRPECQEGQEGQEGQGQVMPAEFVEILEKGTKHLPAFACEEDHRVMFSYVFPRAFEGFWDFLRRFPNPSKIYGIVKNEDDYWYHVRFWAAISKMTITIYLWYCAIQGFNPTKDLGESLAVASQRYLFGVWTLFQRLEVVTCMTLSAPDEKSQSLGSLVSTLFPYLVTLW